MCEKIVEEVKSFSEAEFAQWLRPFLSITESSEEKLIGVRTPILRKLAKKYKDIELETLKKLLHSDIHEIRALAVFIMILKSKKFCQEHKKTLEKQDFMRYFSNYQVKNALF